jgi:hypothetical protein
MLARHIAAALYGIWRLLRLDPGGLRFFERSVEGFWRSWWSLAILYPGGLALAALTRADLLERHGFWRVALVNLVAVFAFYAVYALLIRELARRLGREDRLILFLVAYNWGQVPGLALVLLAAVLAASGLAGIWLVPAIFLSWYGFNFYLAYHAIGAGIGVAAATVFIDFLLTDLLSYVMDGLY